MDLSTPCDSDALSFELALPNGFIKLLVGCWKQLNNGAQIMKMEVLTSRRKNMGEIL